MQCPICKKEMVPYREEPCYDSKKGIAYKRIRYRCQADDVWGRLEIPQGAMSEEQLASLPVAQP